MFRAYTLVDDCTGECPVIEVDFSFSGERVARVLDALAVTCGVPTAIVCDIGPESAGQALDVWTHARGVTLDSSTRASPCRARSSRASTAHSARNV